jgi:hypothetical protein
VPVPAKPNTKWPLPRPRCWFFSPRTTTAGAA